MARYVVKKQSTIKPRSDTDDWDYYEPPLLSNIEVSESDPVFTGLFSSNGDPIWRVNDPIGFRF